MDTSLFIGPHLGSVFARPRNFDGCDELSLAMKQAAPPFCKSLNPRTHRAGNAYATSAIGRSPVRLVGFVLALIRRSTIISTL